MRHEGLHWQATEVARRIAASETESPLRPLDASVRGLEVLDQLRAASGLPSVRASVEAATTNR